MPKKSQSIQAEELTEFEAELRELLKRYFSLIISDVYLAKDPMRPFDNLKHYKFIKNDSGDELLWDPKTALSGDPVRDFYYEKVAKFGHSEQTFEGICTYIKLLMCESGGKALSSIVASSKDYLVIDPSWGQNYMSFYPLSQIPYGVFGQDDIIKRSRGGIIHSRLLTETLFTPSTVEELAKKNYFKEPHICLKSYADAIIPGFHTYRILATVEDKRPDRFHPFLVGPSHK